MYFLLFPPFWPFWQMAIAVAACKRMNRNATVYLLSGFISVLFWWLLVLIFIFFPDPGKISFLIFFLLPFLLNHLFLFPIMLSYLTVAYDRLEKNDYYFRLADFNEYLWRFFAFAYVPYTIWSLQRNLCSRLKEELKEG